MVLPSGWLCALIIATVSDLVVDLQICSSCICVQDTWLVPSGWSSLMVATVRSSGRLLHVKCVRILVSGFNKDAKRLAMCADYSSGK